MAQTRLMPQAQAFHRHGFATDVYLAQVAEAWHDTAGAFAGQQEPISGRQIGNRHALLDDFGGQSASVPQVIAAHDQGCADAECREALFDEAVEAESGKLQDAIGW
ncbi:hypothetical protein D3C76_830600 [compost metagenome]